eukprot:1153615-Pelagomonas_calceolata.AAC.2
MQIDSLKFRRPEEPSFAGVTVERITPHDWIIAGVKWVNSAELASSNACFASRVYHSTFSIHIHIFADSDATKGPKTLGINVVFTRI